VYSLINVTDSNMVTYLITNVRKITFQINPENSKNVQLAWNPQNSASIIKEFLMHAHHIPAILFYL
jgi:hypothetical protein